MNIKRLEAVAEAALPGPLEGFSESSIPGVQKEGFATEPPRPARARSARARRPARHATPGGCSPATTDRR